MTAIGLGWLVGVIWRFTFGTVRMAWQERGPDHFRSILLVGDTGAGKSETGNTILGHTQFDVSNKMSSATQSVTYGTFQHGGYEYRVFDTPGWFDTSKDDDEIRQALREYATYSPHGLDVVLFVTPEAQRRLTVRTTRTLQMYYDAFSQAIKPYTGIVFTNGGAQSLDQTKANLKQACLKDNNNHACEFWNIVSDNSTDSKARRMSVMGELTEERRAKDRQDLLDSIQWIVDGERWGPYRNEVFESALNNRKSLDDRINKLRLSNNRQYLRNLRKHQSEGSETTEHVWQQLEIREAQEEEEAKEWLKVWRTRLLYIIGLAWYVAKNHFFYPKQFIAVWLTESFRCGTLYISAAATHMAAHMMRFELFGPALEMVDKFIDVADFWPFIFAFLIRPMWSGAAEAHGIMVDLVCGTCLAAVIIGYSLESGDLYFAEQNVVSESLLGYFIMCSILCMVRTDDNGPNTPWADLRWRMFWADESHEHIEAVSHEGMEEDDLEEHEDGINHQGEGRLAAFNPLQYMRSPKVDRRRDMNDFERDLLAQNMQLMHQNLVLQHSEAGNGFTVDALKQFADQNGHFAMTGTGHFERAPKWHWEHRPPGFHTRLLLLLGNSTSILLLLFPSGLTPWVQLWAIFQTVVGIYLVQDWLPQAVNQLTESCDRRVSEAELVDHVELDHHDPSWVVHDLSHKALKVGERIVTRSLRAGVNASIRAVDAVAEEVKEVEEKIEEKLEGEIDPELD